MADYTLTADTLWSDISSIVDTDGDIVDLSNFTLTIDTTVLPAVDWRGGPGSKLYCNNTSSSDVIVINCYQRYKFNSISTIELRGSMIDIATGFDGTTGQVVDSLIPLYNGDVWQCWLRDEQRWIYNADIFAGYNKNVAGYDDRYYDFNYDKSLKQFTFNNHLPATTDTLQHPNIVVTYRNFSYGTTMQFRYSGIGSIILDSVAFDAHGSQYYSDGAKTIFNYNFVATGKGGATFTTNASALFTKCAFSSANGSCFDVTKATTGSFTMSGCEFYGYFNPSNIDNGLVDHTWDSCKFIHSYGSNHIVPERGVYTNCEFIWLYDLNGDGSIFDGGYYEERPTSTNYNPLGLGTGNRVFKNFGRPVCGRFLWSSSDSYASYNETWVDCTFDRSAIQWSSSDGFIPADYQHVGARFFNTDFIATSALPDSLDYRYGDVYLQGMNLSDVSIFCGSTSFSLFCLDVSCTGISHSGTDNMLAWYNNTTDSNGWRIQFKLSSNNKFLIDRSAGIYYSSGWFYGTTGDYFIVDLTNDLWFINEISSFTSIDKSRAATGLSFSFDKGATWIDEADITSYAVRPNTKIWMKATWRSDTDRFDNVTLYYDRNAGFTGYPSHYFDIDIFVRLLPASSLNLKTFIAGRNEEYVTSPTGDDFATFIRYREANETGVIKVRKYGFTLESLSMLIQRKKEISTYYTGTQKTDLTLTEAEASAITGVVFQASADAEYTWELDCGGGSLESAYHYVQYKLTNFGEWAGIDTFELDEFLVRDGSMFKTLQARSGEGVKLVNYSGKVSGMTKDDGTVYVPPVDVIMTIDNIVVGSTVYIHTTDDDTEILKTTASSSTVSATISGLNGKPYEVVIRKASSVPYYVEWTSTGAIGTTDINLTANQQEM